MRIMALQETQKSSRGFRTGKGKAVYAHMGIWRQGEHIHLALPKEKDFHTTVNNKEGSIRCHKNLFNKLKKLLVREECW